MKITRTADAKWSGRLETGKGVISTKSEVLNNTAFTVASRFNVETFVQKTNPDELLAAAHASCYTLALTNHIQQEGYIVEEISTIASVQVYTKDNSLAIEEITLFVKALVPGMKEEQFNELAEHAKFNCPISKALAVVPMKLVIDYFGS
jgi:lipoyl-dependent peroxiredoxin